MATLLMIVAHILTLLIILAIVRSVYKGGGTLLAVFATIFLLIFGTVSAVESGMAAQGSGLTKFVLFLFIVFEAILLPIAFSAS